MKKSGRCPACFMSMNVDHYGDANRPLTAGDYSVCPGCSAMVKFDMALNPHIVSQSEARVDLGHEGLEAILMIQRSVAMVKGVDP